MPGFFDFGTLKFLEHIIVSTIMAHLDEHKHLSQRAFRKGHSCGTQLAMVINGWSKILGNIGQVDTFILVVEQAIDRRGRNQHYMAFIDSHC